MSKVRDAPHLHGSRGYLPALRFHALTSVYDPVVRLTTRERLWKARLLASSEIRDGMHVLDLACGTGTLAVMVKRAQPRAEVVGLDADAEILSAARRKAKAAGQPVGLIRGLSNALPYQNACFDRVLSTLFFHHLDWDQKTQTVAEIYRVLKPGGRLLVADWGKPTGWIMRVLFYAIQIFDGFPNTRDNVNGRLPELFAAVGFDVAIGAEINTMFGTLTLYSASTQGKL